MNQDKFVEKNLRPINGYVMLFVIIAGILLSSGLLLYSIFMIRMDLGASAITLMAISIICLITFIFITRGLKINRPNEARVFTVFGAYHGTVKTSGFYFVNPFSVSFAPEFDEPQKDIEKSAKDSFVYGKSFSGFGGSNTISLKSNACDNGIQKVNDVLGNPINIGAVVIWYVENPTKAVFNVENYKEYISIQSDSAVRNVARLYPYDIFDENEINSGASEKTLRGSSSEIAETMKSELQKRVEGAGLVIEEVRITHLAYAEEIAAAMLQRQQAEAIIAARRKIVDGAVGMAKMAVEKLGEDDVIFLDIERKAAMVSNLLVVLCGNRDAQPVVNSGTIH